MVVQVRTSEGCVKPRFMSQWTDENFNALPSHLSIQNENTKQFDIMNDNEPQTAETIGIHETLWDYWS